VPIALRLLNKSALISLDKPGDQPESYGEHYRHHSIISDSLAPAFQLRGIGHKPQTCGEPDRIVVTWGEGLDKQDELEQRRHENERRALRERER
jgi:hypothetical protein